jgi:hypothetical protein
MYFDVGTLNLGRSANTFRKVPSPDGAHSEITEIKNEVLWYPWNAELGPTGKTFSEEVKWPGREDGH